MGFYSAEMQRVHDLVDQLERDGKLDALFNQRSKTMTNVTVPREEFDLLVAELKRLKISMQKHSLVKRVADLEARVAVLEGK